MENTIAPKVIMVPIDRVHDNDKNFYVSSDASIDTMAADITVVGKIIHPLSVKDYKDRPDNYIIISGHRKKAGAKKAGLKEIPVIVETYQNEDEEMSAMIAANDNRPKTSIELAKEMTKRKEMWGRKKGTRSDLKGEKSMSTGKKLAEHYDLSAPTIDKYITILAKAPKMFARIDRGSLSIENVFQLTEFMEKYELLDNSEDGLIERVINLIQPGYIKQISAEATTKEDAFIKCVKLIPAREKFIRNKELESVKQRSNKNDKKLSALPKAEGIVIEQPEAEVIVPAPEPDQNGSETTATIAPAIVTPLVKMEVERGDTEETIAPPIVTPLVKMKGERGAKAGCDHSRLIKIAKKLQSAIALMPEDSKVYDITKDVYMELMEMSKAK